MAGKEIATGELMEGIKTTQVRNSSKYTDTDRLNWIFKQITISELMSMGLDIDYENISEDYRTEIDKVLDK